MITVEQARQRFSDAVRCRQSVELVPIAKALSRVAAQNIVSTIAVPLDDNSAMDGFAVNSHDLSGDINELTISQRVPAGIRPIPLSPNTAARIFTGGVLPKNADTVIIQEDCEYSADCDSVKIMKSVTAGENIRRKGQDISIASKIVNKGQTLNSIHLGLIASIGEAEVSVYKQIRVAIFSTGNELVEPGEKLADGQIYNSNRTMLLAACEQLGYQTLDCGIVEDTLAATKMALSSAAESADVIISSGGVSVGDEDHIKPAVEALGKLEQWKVQMKPGKPVVLGRVAETPIVGLPGNPVSSYVVFQLLARPLLESLQGQSLSNLRTHRVIAAFDKSSVQREEFIRVCLTYQKDGMPKVELFENQSSGVLSSLSWADGIVRQHIDQKISKGETVEFLPMREGML